MGLARPHQEPDAPPQTHRLLKFRRLSSGARLGPEAQPGPATCPRRDAGCVELAGPPTPAGPGEPWAGRWKDHVGQRARPWTARGRSRPRPRPAGGRQRGLRAAGDAPPAVALRESGQGPAFWATCRARPVPSAPHGDPARGRLRRVRCPERGAWGRGESSHRDRVAGFVMKPTSTSPGPSHVTSASCSSLCPSAGTPWGNRHRSLGVQAALAPRSWGGGRGGAAWTRGLASLEGARTRSAHAGCARQAERPAPGTRSGEEVPQWRGAHGGAPRPSEGSACGVGPVARDCPHSVHVCEAAPSVPGTRRPAHLELTCLA